MVHLPPSECVICVPLSLNLLCRCVSMRALIFPQGGCRVLTLGWYTPCSLLEQGQRPCLCRDKVEVAAPNLVSSQANPFLLGPEVASWRALWRDTAHQVYTVHDARASPMPGPAPCPDQERRLITWAEHEVWEILKAG